MAMMARKLRTMLMLRTFIVIAILLFVQILGTREIQAPQLAFLTM
jgi:hypothetical protein